MLLNSSRDNTFILKWFSYLSKLEMTLNIYPVFLESKHLTDFSRAGYIAYSSIPWLIMIRRSCKKNKKRISWVLLSGS